MRHLGRSKIFTPVCQQINFLRNINDGGWRNHHISAAEINANGYLPFPEGFATKAIHYAQEPEMFTTKPMVTPIVNSVNFKHVEPNIYDKFSYGRAGNPTRDALEKCLACLENGNYCYSYSSGMGAVTSALGLLNNGDHIVCGDDIYSGTLRVFHKIAPQFGIEVSLVEARELKNVENAIRPNTKMIWTETPTNPTLKVIDMAGISAIAKKHNLISVVDSTFPTPYLQRPLEYGIDISMQSLTKFANGHADVIMGALTTRRKDLADRLRFIQANMGIIPSPFDCYLVLRGLKTLDIRKKKHMENAYALAKFLETHPKVEKVLYPGLTSHPQHELYKKQTSGPPGMCSFYVKGEFAEAKKLLTSIKVFTLAESLGGYQSLLQVPAIMSHKTIPEELKVELGMTVNLIRMSVGLEDASDLIADLDQALNEI